MPQANQSAAAAKSNKKSLALKLPPALGSYANLFTPREVEGSSSGPKYSVCLLWDKNDKGLAQLKSAIAEVAIKRFGPEAAKWLATPGSKFRNPLRDGTVEKPGDDTYAGKLFVNASSTRQPGVVAIQSTGGERKLVKVFMEEDAYSGCTFVASVSLFAFDKAGNKGVGVGLNNLLVVKKGERLSGKSAEADFADFVDEGALPAEEVDPIG
jgi:hypothetical protein